jgi:hypothetical protein
LQRQFASIEPKYATKIALNTAVDGLGEEIASDINDLEVLVKSETAKIEQL